MKYITTLGAIRHKLLCSKAGDSGRVGTHAEKSRVSVTPLHAHVDFLQLEFYYLLLTQAHSISAFSRSSHSDADKITSKRAHTQAGEKERAKRHDDIRGTPFGDNLFGKSLWRVDGSVCPLSRLSSSPKSSTEHGPHIAALFPLPLGRTEDVRRITARDRCRRGPA